MNEADPLKEEQETTAKDYWGPEMWEMIEAQSASSEVEPKLQEVTPPEEFPPRKFPEHMELTPEALHDWIVTELGDNELAQRINEHPEITKEIIEGKGLPSKDFFGMIRAIGNRDTELAHELVREALLHERLLHPSIQRTVGNSTESEKEQLLLRTAFKTTEYATVPYKNERKKTDFERESFDYANNILDELRGSHGLPAFPVAPEQFHIFDTATLPKGSSGDFALLNQEARVAFKDASPAVILNDTIHELAHFKSYGSIRVDKTNKEKTLNVARYRLGLLVQGGGSEGGKDYLRMLNEAVTEETANRLLKNIPEDHPVFGEVVKKQRSSVAQAAKDFPEDIEEIGSPDWIVDVVESANHPEYNVAYTKARKMMFGLFDKFYEKNPERFEGKTEEEVREELFVMLQKAMFTGNILPFGRLFNDTFGHGKFREFGHLQTTEEQQAFIEGL
jgi:hypothetical protein